MWRSNLNFGDDKRLASSTWRCDIVVNARPWLVLEYEVKDVPVWLDYGSDFDILSW
jgi:hypothetical protein